MKLEDSRLSTLRQVITENLRIQRGGTLSLPYVDVNSAVVDSCALQNHVVFARRGCGKTLLLHHAARNLGDSARSVYLNCEDVKRHSFPNVLIEILDTLFAELEQNLRGWFGKKKRSRVLIQGIRADLKELRQKADQQEESIRRAIGTEASRQSSIGGSVGTEVAALNVKSASSAVTKDETVRTYKLMSDKVRDLDMWLPRLKKQVQEFFQTSSTVKAVFLHIDDFYHLKRVDQPYVIDFIHRLCKDLPLYFKIATLRHASSLYVDRDGQPIGAQERHDYQPINIDYTFSDFKRTRDQNKRILYEFGKLAKLKPGDIDDLFKGEGFDRLVMAGGGVPRDTLSLFLEVLSNVKAQSGDRIGKDDVRILSRSNFERRIEELKQDSEGNEQDSLMKGIYVLREFCLEKKSNVFMLSERVLQQRDELRDLVNRLLDYRIIHSAASALTHKSQSGTFQAFAIDIGCYANLRKLDRRFNELDLSDAEAKEKVRSAPILEPTEFDALWNAVPQNAEASMMVES